MTKSGATVTRVYRYGLLPPTRGAERIADQIARGHAYQNTLVEIEHRRRDAWAALPPCSEDWATSTTAVAAAEAALADVRARIAAARGTRRRAPVPPALHREIVATQTALKAARADLRVARTAAKDDPVRRAAVAAIDETAKAEVKAARAASGLYWGSYLRVEQAMDLARQSHTPPSFRRWTGDGAVTVQIQHGMTVADLDTDTRLQLDRTPQPVPTRDGRPRERGRPLPRVRLRIGSEGREPLWGEWPVILHRPLPPEAQIMWATVQRTRLAGQDRWSLHLTLRLPAPVRAPEHGTGAVAVDLGWHRDPDGLVAGVVCDETGVRETITVPARVVGALRKADDIRSIRDKAQAVLQAALVAWLAEAELVSEAHAEALRQVGQWHSPGRFVALWRWWLQHRCEGDLSIISALDAWYQQDRHLWLYETHARRGALAHRRDVYRQVAARLAQRYDTLVIERLDLRALATDPPPESAREVSVAPAPRQRVMAAPSELRTALVQAFAARGGTVVQVPAGPAMTLLARWRERSGDVETPGIAREARSARFARIRRERAAAGGSVEAAGAAPLASEAASS